jgi:hypothetical protein
MRIYLPTTISKVQGQAFGLLFSNLSTRENIFLGNRADFYLPCQDMAVRTFVIIQIINRHYQQWPRLHFCGQ